MHSWSVAHAGSSRGANAGRRARARCTCAGSMRLRRFVGHLIVSSCGVYVQHVSTLVPAASLAPEVRTETFWTFPCGLLPRWQQRRRDARCVGARRRSPLRSCCKQRAPPSHAGAARGSLQRGLAAGAHGTAAGAAGAASPWLGSVHPDRGVNASGSAAWSEAGPPRTDARRVIVLSRAPSRFDQQGISLLAKWSHNGRWASTRRRAARRPRAPTPARRRTALQLPVASAILGGACGSIKGAAGRAPVPWRAPAREARAPGARELLYRIELCRSGVLGDGCLGRERRAENGVSVGRRR